MSVALVLTGCSGGDDPEGDLGATTAAEEPGPSTGSLSSEELQGALPTAEEMPDGYVEEPVEAEKSWAYGEQAGETPECRSSLDEFVAFDKQTMDDAKARTAFTRPQDGAYVDVRAGSYDSPEKASEAFSTITAPYQICESWTEISTTGEETLLTPSQLSFPEMGDESYAGRVLLGQEDQQISVNLVLTRVNTNFLFMIHGSVGGVDAAETEQIARTSVEKLENASP